MFRFIRFQKPAFRRYATYKTFNNTYGTSTFKPPTKAVLISGSVVALYLISCIDEVPISHRKRLVWLPLWAERKIGDWSYKSTLSEFGPYILPKNHPVQHKVESIVARLLASSEKLIHSSDLGTGTFSRDSNDQLKWEVFVINNPRLPPNAFVTPGGKIFVFSSIFALTQNDDGLATVLAHEISHQLARHNAEALSYQPFLLMFLLILVAVFGTNILDYISQLALLKNLRVAETEADYIGMKIMANACFHPEAGKEVWRRFMERGLGMERNVFLSSHPNSDTRMRNMESWMPELQTDRAQAGCRDVIAFWGFQ